MYKNKVKEIDDRIAEVEGELNVSNDFIRP